jgi:hypothetical protein
MQFRPSEQNAPTGATQFYSNKIIIAVRVWWFKGTVVGEPKVTSQKIDKNWQLWHFIRLVQLKVGLEI